MREYIAKVAGPELRDRVIKHLKDGVRLWYGLTDEERFERHVQRPAFWIHPASNTYDLATAVMPNLMRSRMDEIGIDLSIVYPTFGLLVPRIPEEDVRRAAWPGPQPHACGVIRRSCRSADPSGRDSDVHT